MLINYFFQSELNNFNSLKSFSPFSILVLDKWSAHIILKSLVHAKHALNLAYFIKMLFFRYTLIEYIYFSNSIFYILKHIRNNYKIYYYYLIHKGSKVYFCCILRLIPFVRIFTYFANVINDSIMYFYLAKFFYIIVKFYCENIFLIKLKLLLQASFEFPL